MNLLITTQKVDFEDANLGFFHDWILEFARHCEKVTVICLNEGKHDLPDNVTVLSLGKEKNGQGLLSRFLYIFRFYKYIWQYRREYDSVFVHMNSEYVVLGGLAWKMLGKKISLWYVHRALPMSLRIAERFVESIFTASVGSCNLKTKKIKVIGHGINTVKYDVKDREISKKFKIIYVGRITSIKNQKLVLKAINNLVNVKKELNFNIDFIGGVIYEKDEEYFREIRNYVKEVGLEPYVNFTGNVSSREIVKYYRQADLSVNVCESGLDKSVLESMSCRVPIVVYHKAFEKILENFKKRLLIKTGSEEELSDKIEWFIKSNFDERKKVGTELRQIIIDGFDLSSLVEKIIKTY